MLKRTICLLSVIAFALTLSLSVMAEDTTKTEAKEKSGEKTEKAEKKEEKHHDYIGAKKCRICHRPEFKSWEETVHAHAWDLLSEEEKKNEECISCHITGHTAKGEMLEGVQCEACHGPGADYMKKSIMEDRELSIENGLVIPTEETCTKCHNEKSPTFKGFDFEKSKANPEAIHVLKSASEEKESTEEE